MFPDVLGHTSSKEYLEKALALKQLPNTLLFAGPDGIGKKKLALALASHLLQAAATHHPDFYLLTPEGKSGLHSIESFRKAIENMRETPFQAPVKCFVIDAAERMQPAAANALLKTLEEPTPDSYFFLISAEPEAILPTIVSRCARLNGQPLLISQIETILSAHNLPPHFAKMAQGSAAKAIELAQHPELEEARKLLFSLLGSPPAYPNLSASLEQISRLLETEDPLERHGRAAYLFTSIALYFRDQELKRLAPTSPLLYFPEIPLSAIPAHWEEDLEDARLGFERNLKLSTCLEAFFL